MMNEPIFHYFVDCLPEGHRLYGKTLYCDECPQMLNACNNEFMTAWMESDRGNHCLDCFYRLFSQSDARWADNDGCALCEIPKTEK